MIYFNNAATSWPKPEPVYKAIDACLRAHGSPMRSVGAGADAMHACREEIASFLGIADPGRLGFLPGCTYALNLAILGLPWVEGDVAIMSGLEHHAVSRPLRKTVRERGIRLEVAPYSPDDPIDLALVESVLKRGRVRLVACTMASNVTGDILPVAEVIRLAHRYDALCLVDAAQTAGVLPIDVGALGPDMVAFAGHKAMFGPPGIGGLYVAPHVQLRTLAEGGTGHDSGKHEMSGSFPASFEVGTHNLPAISGLAEGVRWIRQTGLDAIRKHECRLAERLVSGLREIRGIKVHGGARPDRRTSVASLTFEGQSPQDVGRRLAERHQVVGRFGYHCAPLAHETIGTLPGPGTFRLSVGYFNTDEEVDRVLSYIAEA